MNYSNPNMRNDDRKDDGTPFSRIFVVCSKQLCDDDLKEPFERFGKIESFHMPRDRSTGESKGVAYIKYSKTSSAAAAIEAMHLKYIGNEGKPIKVMVAANKNELQYNNDNKYKRLFIKVPKQATESEIKKEFSQFGYVESVMIQRDKVRNESKGFAYVNFDSFLATSKAFEECDRKYKPIFAVPKDLLKRSNMDSNYSMDYNYPVSPHMNFSKDNFYDRKESVPFRPGNSIIRAQSQGYTCVEAICTPQVSQKYIEQLFNVIPGMTRCVYSTDTYNGICKATISYEDAESAAHAVERLNNFEFPSGEIITVKPVNPLSKAANQLKDIVLNFKNAIDAGSPDIVQLADAIAQASTLIKAATTAQENFCNVPLPPQQPVLSSDTPVAKRCFIVCKPQPPPLNALKDVFSRFGDLIDVVTFPNKSFGFVKYASVESANSAIEKLNEAVVCGVTLKVLEADEKLKKDNESDHADRKRMKLSNED